MIEKIPHIKGHQTWCYFKFGEICKIIGGSQPPKKEFVFEPISGYIRLIQIRDYKSDNHLTFIPESKAKRFCSVDDVMIGRYGPPIFQILRGIEGAYNVALMKACPIDKRILDNEYLYYFLHNQTLRNYVIFHSTRTAGQDGVRKELLQEYPIYLPPLNEQKRIVTKIEALQTRSSAVKEELEAIKPLLDQFRQSVLAAAFRGDLTKDWREQNPDVEPAEVLLERIREQLPQSKRKKDNKSLPDPFEINKLWQWVKLSEVCNSITDGDHQAPPKSSCGIPFLVISNISKGKLDFDDTRYVPENYYNKLQENKKPRNGDIVYSVVGSYGIPVLVDTDKEFCFQRHIALLKPSNWLNNRYLLYALKSDFVYRQATNVATGTTQLTVTLTALRKIKIPFTSLEEQKEIVRRIESLFKLADSIEQQYQQAEIDLETLNQSILAKAFRGELVPQDPNDEPASVLLERIKKERDRAKATAKKSKTKKKSAKKQNKQLDIPGI